MSNFLICALLTASCISGVCGLFLCENHNRKISSLSIAYASFLALIALLCVGEKTFFEITAIFINLTIIFAANLFVANRLIRNIGEKTAEAVLVQSDEEDEN